MSKVVKLPGSPARVAAATLAVLVWATGCKSDSGSSNPASDSGGTGGSAGSGGSADSGGSGGSGGSAGSGGLGAGGAAGASACESPALDSEISVVGVYEDDFGSSHSVSDDAWVSGDSRFEVVDFSDPGRFIIAENDDDNEYNPGLFSRFEWTYDGDDLFYCQSVYDAESEAEARSAERADADDLSSGCGGFAWSQLMGIELVGGYDDNFGGGHEISAALWDAGWAKFHLLAVSNEDHWAVAQNDCDNTYNPGLFSRFDWTTSDLGAAGAAGAGSSLYYCQTGYDEASEEAAVELSPADAGDLETGCSGFAWSELVPRD